MLLLLVGCSFNVCLLSVSVGVWFVLFCLVVWFNVLFAALGCLELVISLF